jgi:hypothetical protein
LTPDSTTIPAQTIVQERSDATPPGPVFVIGSARSGTSVLALALAKHSHFWTSGESYALFDLYGEGRAQSAHERATLLSRNSWFNEQAVGMDEFLAALGAGMDALFRSRSKGRRWIDHTPHYVLMADVLAAMFPTARFVHIVRDGRRVVRSMVHFGSRLRTVDGTGFLPPWVGDFIEACRAWRRSVEAGLDFATRQPSRCLTVVNEQLVADAEEGFRKIFRFIDVPDEPAPANMFRTWRINSSFGPDTKDSAAMRRLLEPCEEWPPELKKTFAREAGACLIRLGMADAADLGLENVASDAGPDGAC